MSYHGLLCPCGDKKGAGTMLCTGCEAAFASHPSMLVYQDLRKHVDDRRHAATILVTMARDRNRTAGRK